jgi:tRNA-2-methylthio-N6-dimethylallyladenosine synthase
MNVAESAALKGMLRERGWSAASGGETADLVLINTCSVRQTAEERVFGRLAQYGALKKKTGKTPFALVVAGCMAQRLGKGLKERGADYVMGPSARALFPLILDAVEKDLGGGIPGGEGGAGTFEAFPAEAPAFSFAPCHLEEDTASLRSFVPIMHGCNNFCSYCIVPYVRGREISRNPGAVLAEMRLLADRGVREITLLGQNVNSYNWEGRLDFPDLLERAAEAAEKTSIRWIRFLSSHPKDLSPRAVRVMAEHPQFCRHLHLCVQHGSNKVLKAMNRRYTREAYLALVEEIRALMPGISLSTDILVGFPGETEEDLEQTLDLMGRVKFLYAYMYHYNPREGTAAYELPGRIGEALKRRRLSRVIALQKAHTLELLQERLGSRERVLVEGISRKNADEFIARTERDEMVVLPGGGVSIGSFAEVTLASLRGHTFRGGDAVVLD